MPRHAAAVTAALAILAVTGCWTGSVGPAANQPTAPVAVAAVPPPLPPPTSTPNVEEPDPTTAVPTPAESAPTAPAAAEVPSAPLPPVVAAATSHQVTASVLVGSSIPINGLNYNAGTGIRGGATFGHYYLGGMLAVHQGDSLAISWPAVAAFGTNAGVQAYKSLPVFAVIDGGYKLRIPVGSIATFLTPYLSTGLLVIGMSSSGVYGNSNIANSYFVVGGGFSYGVPISERYSIGVHFRGYDTGDTKFSFGDYSKGTIEHGFSTSVFYAAFYLELETRF
jgi:hypothetical protein